MVDAGVEEMERTGQGMGDACDAVRMRAMLAELAADAGALSIADFESESSGSLEPAFEHVERVLGSASELFLRVVEHYEAIETQRRSLAPPVAVDALMTSIDEAIEEDEGVGRIVAIAFLGRIGVRERSSALRSARRGDRWEAVDLLGGALREVVKACSALDLSIAEVESLPAGGSYFVSELERSIDTRRAYRRLRMEVVEGGEPTLETIVPRIRKAAASLAKLVGRPIYVHLRTRDRHQIRRFQQRIAEYLKALGGASLGGTVGELAARDGVRLHRDLENLTELLMNVNHRAELRGHDATVAFAAADSLANGRSVAEVMRSLAALGGRDPQLDAMIDARQAPSPGDLEGLLRRIVHDVDADGGVRRSFVMPSRLLEAGE